MINFAWKFKDNFMKNALLKTLILILFISCSEYVFSFSVVRRGLEYLPVDSIQKEDSVNYRRFKHYIKTQLTAGYSYLPKMEDIPSRTNHAFEIGLARSNVMSAMEFASTCYYLSNEFLFNNNQFSIGPKIGANFFIWAFGLGTEFVYYTNFHENTLHWIVYMGMGLGAGNVRLGVHIPFYNKHFQDTGRVSLSLTFPVCTLSKRNINPK
ncbi:hypothetical protein FACS189440_17030 [Bacteroidia bacterium]|nr:hypothetical protein FACS189423_04800 [Bacteroidia bacterium]GHT50137.1 hypothetical protein FACS189440_17030 [Bacteroidia bacterium]